MKRRPNNTVCGAGLPTLMATAALPGFGVYALAANDEGRGRKIFRVLATIAAVGVVARNSSIS